jgi:hypothetical protein
MAFGIRRHELERWKARAAAGEIAYLTHYWLDPRFPGIRTVTKVGCADLAKLVDWCRTWGFDPAYIHRRNPHPHFDLFGPRQKEILLAAGEWEQVRRFDL